MEKDFPVRWMRAFTLLELLLVVAVASVVIGIAIPAWGKFLAGVRVQTATAELASGLRLARSEAIKRQVRATLCKSSDGQNCTTSGDWQQGWMIFEDSDNYGLKDTTEAVIRVSTGQHQGVRIWGNTEFERLVSYTPMGATRQVSGALGIGSFMICSHRKGEKGRRIVIARTGRADVREYGCD